MQQVMQALEDVKELYQKVVGKPAPGIVPGAYAPFPPGVDPLRHAIEEVHHLKTLSEHMSEGPTPLAWIPRADCYAIEDGFLVCVDVPGVSREDLKLMVKGGELIVRGELKRPVLESGARPMAIERPWGAFERRFALPAGCRPESVKARYLQGVLELRFSGEVNMPAAETPVEVA